MGEFKTWCESPEQLDEFLKMFQPQEDPGAWTRQKRVCKYCKQPAQTMGSYSDEGSKWAKCKNPQCPSQARTKGLLEPNETDVGGAIGAIGRGLKSAAASIM